MMQEKTALNRFGDVILLLGTAASVLWFVVAAFIGLLRLLEGITSFEQIVTGGFMTFVVPAAIWIVSATTAYLFNGRTPVSVLKNWFSRAQQ